MTALSPGVAVTGTVVDTVEALEPYVEAWDALACELSLPYCAPGWLLPWWRHMRPDDARLRAVVVRHGEELVGIAPFYARPRPGGLASYALLGTELLTARIEPLARPDLREDVAATIVRTLAAARPVPATVRLEGVPVDSPWTRDLARLWPGRGRAFLHRDNVTPAPVVTLGEEGFAAWMQGRSSNFRQQMRRGRRKLEQAGGAFRTARTPEAIAAGLKDFARLHGARWEWRGGSGALRPGLLETLGEAGERLVDAGRFRLELIELDGRVISAHVFVSAGRETSYWLGGFDDAHAAYRPSMLALVAQVEECFQRGDARLDLGPGDQDYKYRLADAEETLEWVTLVPPGPHYARALAAVAPQVARRAVAARLSPEAKARIKRLLRRRSG